jgi:DNA-binding NarL/FixJ family response regulator
VSTANDAQSALEQTAAGQPPFDVVITDIHMPRMNGIDLTTLLLERRPRQCVVVVTGDADETLARAALARGAAGYLLKPFALRELQTIVTSALTANSTSP